MTARLELLSYTRLPKLGVGSALSLAKILLRRAPRRSSHAVRQAASDVEQAVAKLEAEWAEQIARRARTDLRPLGRRLDATWGAIRDRLLNYTVFPDDSPERARAIAIHDLLFPDGLAFLKLAFMYEHAESERRIQLIDARGLAKDLARLVGAGFVEALRATHRAYGEALGIIKTTPVLSPIQLAERLRALVDAMSDYALQLIALARHDAAIRETVDVALAPIDEFRVAAARHAAASRRDDGDADDPPANESPPRPTGSG
ncbi:MAG TPA: hypothetical protein VG755_12340 [Nannocystaceae bacterium]|nr:hypothetical protein [Nannocystaceae bacterium]